MLVDLTLERCAQYFTPGYWYHPIFWYSELYIERTSYGTCASENMALNLSSQSLVDPKGYSRFMTTQYRTQMMFGATTELPVPRAHEIIREYKTMYVQCCSRSSRSFYRSTSCTIFVGADLSVNTVLIRTCE